ncbi:hypothetical protein [Pseudomonas chlororaphis]|uniref:hypothetical protein n=1 Tax=Pseudomonas chlororaphis TaxID=587753 RepID=UPI002367A061|nr:hypothetical protein [Pseudomonas chlororaphis]WDH32680.1 hypothetical protein PUP62_17610 [Pseudomonas chlororaphis]WDH38763.1 hypothetical protein PUP51_17610 [Pseudomonas chlororaphis]
MHQRSSSQAVQISGSSEMPSIRRHHFQRYLVHDINANVIRNGLPLSIADSKKTSLRDKMQRFEVKLDQVPYLSESAFGMADAVVACISLLRLAEVGRIRSTTTFPSYQRGEFHW